MSVQYQTNMNNKQKQICSFFFKKDRNTKRNYQNESIRKYTRVWKNLQQTSFGFFFSKTINVYLEIKYKTFPF